MRWAFIALLACDVLASTAVQAQYYGRYYDPPPDAITRLRPGDYGDQPRRPRYDPSNGGTYCVQQGYTVQNGVCKPYRGY
jgi:hypothetical protein